MKPDNSRLVWLPALAACCAIAVWAALLNLRPAHAAQKTDSKPLRLAVMDPLSNKLACDCVKGHAQRKYDRLAEFLKPQIGRPVEVVYGESLATILDKQHVEVDVVIGKQSVVLADAATTHTAWRPIARLTDKTGSTDLTGLFVVRSADPAKSIADLKGYRIVFGPADSEEKHGAALAALDKAGVPRPSPLKIMGTCTPAATEVAAKDADAAVISSYALPLVEGCKAVAKGELRVVGQTAPVPFVTVFARSTVTAEQELSLLAALLAVKSNDKLLTEMESRDGFVQIAADPQPATQPAPAGGPSGAIPGEAAGWTDWRGPHRDALSDAVPTRLPDKAMFLWRRPLSGAALSGVAATDRFMIVADKDEAGERDIFRCLSAETGEPVWKLEYGAAGDMDFTNSPRATPVISDGRAYLLGAFGDLHCVELETGRVVWRKNVLRDFDAKPTTWGLCSTPLIDGDRLYVNPGGPKASLVALDRRDGSTIWKTPGREAAYSSFIVAAFGGVRQIVGFDAESLCGWDPASGRQLWSQTLEGKEFHVPSPIAVGGDLFVVGEENGARLYSFDKQGRIDSNARASQRGLTPDSSTPVILDGLVFGCCGKLVCLDLRDGLRVRWQSTDDAFDDYASLIAGNHRVLITTARGELVLIEATGEAFRPISRLRLFEGKADVWSHPALVRNRLYVREKREVVCVPLGENAEATVSTR